MATSQTGEPLAGTTPVARRWLAVEQLTSWGRDAATDSGPVAAALAVRAARAGARLALIRQPHRRRHDDLLRVFLADTTVGRTRLTTLLCTPAELATLPLPDSPDGPLPGAETTDPVLLVCTHARRDQCCAIDGRALTRQLVGQLPHVWECSHLGGHRFAPTAVVLPTGYLYGRLDASTALAAVKAAAAGEVEIARARGRSTWEPAGQVAELAVRELTGERLADALTVASPPGSLVRVQHRDGRRWDVTVEYRTLAGSRPESCGKTDKPVTTHTVTAVHPAP